MWLLVGSIGLAMWLGYELISMLSAVFGRCRASILRFLVDRIYRLLFGPTRRTRLHFDANHTLGHHLLFFAIVILANQIWNNFPLFQIYGLILLVGSTFSLLVEMLFWGQSGFKRFFEGWITSIQAIKAGGEDNRAKRIAVKAELEDLTVASVLPLFLTRFTLGLLLITGVYFFIYRLLLSLQPLSLIDTSGQAVTDSLSLLSLTINVTLHTDTDIHAMSGLARLVLAIHAASSVYLFVLLVSTVVTMTQEEFKAGKERLLKMLGNDIPNEPNS